MIGERAGRDCIIVIRSAFALVLALEGRCKTHAILLFWEGPANGRCLL